MKALMTDDIRSELSRLRRAKLLRQKKRKREKSSARFVKNLAPTKRKVMQEHFTVQRKKLRSIYMKHTLTR